MYSQEEEKKYKTVTGAVPFKKIMKYTLKVLIYTI